MITKTIDKLFNKGDLQDFEDFYNELNLYQVLEETLERDLSEEEKKVAFNYAHKIGDELKEEMTPAELSYFNN